MIFHHLLFCFHLVLLIPSPAVPGRPPTPTKHTGRQIWIISFLTFKHHFPFHMENNTTGPSARPKTLLPRSSSADFWAFVSSSTWVSRGFEQFLLMSLLPSPAGEAEMLSLRWPLRHNCDPCITNLLWKGASKGWQFWNCSRHKKFSFRK